MPKIYKRKNLPWQSLDEKTLILSSLTGEVHQLNPTGTWIWNHLATPTVLDDLVEKFLVEVEADRLNVTRDFDIYLTDLIGKSLVEIHE